VRVRQAALPQTEDSSASRQFLTGRGGGKGMGDAEKGILRFFSSKNNTIVLFAV
jgi:hypothetical protein